jgi:hypothetical protein
MSKTLPAALRPLFALTVVVLLGCGVESPAGPDLAETQWADIILTYDRPSEATAVPSDATVSFVGSQCNPSGNPRVPPFSCRATPDGNGRYYCGRGIVWRLPELQQTCDNAVWVDVLRISGEVIEQTAAGVSANEIRLTRIVRRASGREEAVFSVLAGGILR